MPIVQIGDAFLLYVPTIATKLGNLLVVKHQKENIEKGIPRPQYGYACYWQQ